MKPATLEPRRTARSNNALESVIKGDRRLLVRQGRKPVAALISYRDLRLLERLIRKEEDRQDIAAAKKALQEPGEIPWEQIKKELGL